MSRWYEELHFLITDKLPVSTVKDTFISYSANEKRSPTPSFGELWGAYWECVRLVILEHLYAS